ncbi:MAG: hypothetical protein NVS3B10_19000 [Polyangiales bacterium]
MLAQRIGVAVFVGSLLVACGGELGGLGGGSVLGNLACPELQGGAMNAQFDADARANATIRAFVTASGDLASVAARAEAEVGAACERMGKDLGVAPEQMAAQNGQSRVASACNAVSARMDAILRAGASASIKAQATPPECHVDANVQASCSGQCAVSVDPGYVKAHCQPGHLYGRCEGTCSGQCNGTCNGECQGECAGQGQASGGAASANGHCAGQCKGTCKGSCSADCHGGCNVDFKEPKCDVQVKAPSADAHCDASCKAHADLTAQCTPPRVEVRASIETGDMGRLVATLRANLPALVTADARSVGHLGGDIETLVRTGAELPHAFGQITAHAGACVAAAASACVQAQASIHVSVQASASISGKAGAHAGG